MTQTWPPPPLPPTRRRAWWRVPALVALTVVVVAAVLALFVFRPRVTRIEGHSMSPTLRNDDRLISLRVLGPVERGDIVCMRYPLNTSKSFASRVVGLPGERISIVNGVVRAGDTPIDEPYLTAESRRIQDFGPVQLGADEYSMLGDNRRNSSDSREWGPVARPLIWCRMRWIWWHGDTLAH